MKKQHSKRCLKKLSLKQEGQVINELVNYLIKRDTTRYINKGGQNGSEGSLRTWKIYDVIKTSGSGIRHVGRHKTHRNLEEYWKNAKNKYFCPFHLFYYAELYFFVLDEYSND